MQGAEVDLVEGKALMSGLGLLANDTVLSAILSPNLVLSKGVAGREGKRDGWVGGGKRAVMTQTLVYQHSPS